MSYFSDRYSSLKLPVAQGDQAGLRRAQIGAIHAIGAYFSQPVEHPGIVVMPTGSGKTAVIGLSGFLLRATRVLILTPSQLVRAQIADQLASLSVLKKAGVFEENFAVPNTKEVKSRLSTAALWEELREFDFVVATPQCASPGIDGVEKPPEDLFDLIIMDEAHHSEAPRWVDILREFKKTRRLLFTATPFRRDKKELKGTLIYNYPLRLAYEDKIFGKLEFLPVSPAAGEDHDESIAREAAKAYKKDIEAGLPHRLMVRTDSKPRADKLAEIYKQHTPLNLEVVHSGHSMKWVASVLERLKSGKIDGIICVAMMGEGFDLPQLKIAAIHAPHKSLAVTLQFIGRFARTGDPKLGDAKFLAIPQDIKAETNELYRESAAWQDIVSNLSAARIEQEVKVKEMAESFEAIEISELSVADVVMTDFKPYFHVKVYRIENAPDLKSVPDLGASIEVLRIESSEEYSSVALLTRQKTRPRWTDLQQFSRIEYDLLVIYYDETSKLLFINSSRRSLDFYKILEDHYGDGTATLVPGPRIDRVLAEIQNPEFFSVGLKNAVQSSNSESYQTRAGTNAQNGITPSDGLLWQRGHVFGKGIDKSGKSVTIGYSSSSKIWSNSSARIGELIIWCQQLAEKLQTKGVVKTGTPLDTLEIGEEVEMLPSGLLGVGWSDDVFRTFPQVTIPFGGTKIERQLLDLELGVDFAHCSDDVWDVTIQHVDPPIDSRVRFKLESGKPHFEWVGPPSFRVLHDNSEIDFLTYLKHHPLAFFLDDFSRLEGGTIFFNRNAEYQSLRPEALQPLDWIGNGINIEQEFGEKIDFDNPKSIQEFLGKTLVGKNPAVVFYDHGTGEMADFVTLEPTVDAVRVGLYHCKGSGGKEPGDRVGDAYEVCGQVVKCLIWFKKRGFLRNRIAYREENSGGKSRYLKGDRNVMFDLLSDKSTKRIEPEVYLVQPGISTAKMSEKIGHIVGAASDYVRRAISGRVFLIGSP